MSDLQDTLDAIDQLAVHECGWCSQPLHPDGLSLDFCNSWCQQAWVERRNEVVQLAGYEEPDDLPEWVGNNVELYSSEVSPRRPDSHGWNYGFRRVEESRDSVTFELTVDTAQFEAACERTRAAFERFSERMAEVGEAWVRICRGLQPDGLWVDEVRDWHPIDLMDSLKISSPAVEVRCAPAEPFGSDFDFEQTPAKSLPHEPPPAVMPSVPEQDWQALIDSQSSSYRAPDRFRRPFGRRVR